MGFVYSVVLGFIWCVAGLLVRVLWIWRFADRTCRFADWIPKFADRLLGFADRLGGLLTMG